MSAREAERPHWVRPDGSVDLAAWRDEVAARRSGGWGVWHMHCPRCARVWVAVAPLCAAEHPMECPGCGRMAGEPYTPEPCASTEARCAELPPGAG